jgi:hypothetical protein
VTTVGSNDGAAVTIGQQAFLDSCQTPQAGRQTPLSPSRTDTYVDAEPARIETWSGNASLHDVRARDFILVKSLILILFPRADLMFSCAAADVFYCERT